MPFEAPMTIKDVLGKIVETGYVLPSIQREFVWGTEQIEKLFDSILRDYPIGSLLLWEIPPAKVESYKFYRFLDKYHELDARHNPPATLSRVAGVRAVLDGQQRLTALVIGLIGSYAEKLPNKRRTNRAAYPVKYLCVDLLNPAGEEAPEFRYRLRFLPEEETRVSNEELWVRTADLFRKLKNLSDVTTFLMRDEIRTATKERASFAADTLGRLYECVNSKLTINYFLERDGDLDKVLQIFIRTNSGGTKLSYSDLLLSIATAAWSNVDAREEIHRFVDELNSVNEELSFEKDFVLKAALVLADIPDIRFSVENFNAANMATIERKWNEIKEALRVAVTLIDQFGYSDRSLIAANALIPIAYYVLRRKLGEEYLGRQAHRADREIVRKWLATVLLRGTFGSMVDTILAALRKVILEKGDAGFPVDAMASRLTELNRPPRYSVDEIDGLLDIGYGDRRTFLLLSLLYPEFDYSEPFHIDHVYPRAKLTSRRLERRGLASELAGQLADQRDCLANLQLLRGRPNQEKSNTDFDEWLKKKYPEKRNREIFLQGNLLPTDLAYRYEDFPNFVEERERIMAKRVKDLLC